MDSINSEISSSLTVRSPPSLAARIRSDAAAPLLRKISLRIPLAFGGQSQGGVSLKSFNFTISSRESAAAPSIVAADGAGAVARNKKTPRSGA
jgi:hypothetical protein